MKNELSRFSVTSNSLEKKNQHNVFILYFSAAFWSNKYPILVLSQEKVYRMKIKRKPK